MTGPKTAAACFAILLGCTLLTAQEMPEEPPLVKHLDLPYAKIEGVDPNLLSLDLYVPEEVDAEKRKPVLIMIHGGGWTGGDKSNRNVVGAKMRHFVGAGYVFCSINYRLSGRPSEKDGLKHPIHAEDCARAIAWIHDHIAEYGGDPQQLHLMGHSAGGHLAGILGTNERFLEAEGKSLSILKSNVLLDPAGIDIPRHLELSRGPGMAAMYRNAFGEDDADWRDASPHYHVSPGKAIPPTLIFHAGDRLDLDQLAPALAQKLTESGSPSQAIDTISLTHREINSLIGMPGDRMTALIMRLHAGEDAAAFPGTFTEMDDTQQEAAMLTRPELAYGEQEAQRLDLHVPSGVQDAPVMLYVHGGGWRIGDKSAVGKKAEFFTGNGWIFASAGYRLLPAGRHPRNVEDIAAATAWLHDRIAEHGGDPDSIFLMGHSAGCHLVSLVATDGRHLEKLGKSLDVIKGVIALDTQAYDIEKLLDLPLGSATYRSVFGEEPEAVRDASPIHHVARGKGIPPFLVCYSRGLGRRISRHRAEQSKAFAAALKAAGVNADVVDASDRSHGEINQRFGDPDDVKVTGKVKLFLESLRTQQP